MVISQIMELSFSFNTMHLKLSAAKWRPSCLGLNVLSIQHMEAQKHFKTLKQPLNYQLRRLYM